ncbi:DNA-3-methyladenine glycosylase [Thalassobacillus sp. CUG 92003]|uniref:DNA-3-methyladenine glycosylase family protein n=1 Tax=Thalassobacillus sp. CUG 92003 TaxID=2736641 RepID=UPI0015E6308E|nr:DNA-3-methyladenine glycosylase [Thalassobacillus sp. CUG 92003]
MWKVRLRLGELFDFDFTLLRWSMDPLVYLSLQDRWVKLPVKLDNDKHILHVQAVGKDETVLEVTSDSYDAKEALIHYAQDLFMADTHHEQIQSHFLNTNLAQLFNRYRGTPIVKDFQLYDCLMKTIIHQQLNMKFAYTLTSRFVERYGEQKDGVWFYPDPAVVANLNYDELRSLQFSQRKSEYVIDISRAIEAGHLHLESLAWLPDSEIMTQLVKYRGIGPWTVQCWLLFGLGRTDLLPKGDIGIQNAMKRYFAMEKKPTPSEMDSLSEQWTPYRSFAALTLWRSIEG